MPQLAEIPDELSVPEFWDLFGDVEHEHLDFKVRADNLTEVFPSMAMTDGGMVIVGIRDDRNIAGCKLDQRTLAGLKPLTIRILTARAGDTQDSLAARMSGVDRPRELFRVLNELSPGAPIAAGTKVKIVTDR